MKNTSSVNTPICLDQTWLTSFYSAHTRLLSFCQKLILEHKEMKDDQAADWFEERYLEPVERLLACIEDFLIDGVPAIPQDLMIKTNLLLRCLEQGTGPHDMVQRYTVSLMEVMTLKQAC